MKKPLIKSIFISALFIFNTSFVYALDCVAPVMDETVYQQAHMIFEGIAGKGRPITPEERAPLEEANLAVKGGSFDDIKAYEFIVTQGWKGASSDDRILVLRNTYWGDGFIEGKSYFVLIPTIHKEFNVLPLCGHTMPIEYAIKNGFLDIIQEINQTINSVITNFNREP